MENTVSSKDLALTVCKALSEKRGKDIVTLYIPCSKELKEVSSTAVKKDIDSGNFDEKHLSSSVIEIIKKQGK